MSLTVPSFDETAWKGVICELCSKQSFINIDSTNFELFRTNRMVGFPNISLRIAQTV